MKNIREYVKVKLDIEERQDENYETLQYHYEQMLKEMGYASIEGVDDGRDEFVQSEYNIYLSE